MEQIEFDVELSAGDLYAFLMRHTYTGASGIFGVLLSIGSWVACALRYEQLDTAARLALFVIGCLFTVVQPVMLYSKARNQARRNKNINTSIHYVLTERGIDVSQGEQQGSVKWDEVRRVVRAKHAVYLYMSPVRAFIFPESQCGGNFEGFCGQLRHWIQGQENSASGSEGQGDNASAQEGQETESEQGE